MIDVPTLRQAFGRRDMFNIGWVCSDNQIDDSLTKPGAFPFLEQFLKTGNPTLGVAQCVVCSRENTLSNTNLSPQTQYIHSVSSSS